MSDKCKHGVEFASVCRDCDDDERHYAENQLASPKEYAATFRNGMIRLTVPIRNEWGHTHCEHAIDGETADRLVNELLTARQLQMRVPPTSPPPA